MAKNYGKIRLLKVLDQLTLANHLGLFSYEEKHGLLEAIKTGILSENQESMLNEKLDTYSDQEELLEIVDYFRKGEQE